MAQRDRTGFIRNLRVAIAQWKHQQLQDITQEYQDTMKLNQYLKLTGLAYNILKEYLDSQGNSKTDSLLKPIIDAIGPVENLSIEDQILVEDAFTHDLLEYPFTYNTSLIDTFDKRNIVTTNIIPNK